MTTNNKALQSLKKLGMMALVGLGLAATGTQAFAEDRDHWRRDRDRREYRYDGDRYRHEYREHDGWRDRGYGYAYRPYYAAPYVDPYATPYVAPYAPPPVYVEPYRPGFSFYFRR